jgi:hypothetical protein
MDMRTYVTPRPGLRFGLLTLKTFQKHKRGRKALWLCDCDCGTKDFEVVPMMLGVAQNCGCQPLPSLSPPVYGPEPAWRPAVGNTLDW